MTPKKPTKSNFLEWKSNIIGLIVMLGTGFLYYEGKLEQMGLWTGIGIGLCCLGLKDQWLGFKKGNDGGKATIILLLITIAMSSCVTSKRCNGKFPCPPMVSKEKTIVKDTTIFIPGESIKETFYVDCDSNGKATIRFPEPVKEKKSLRTELNYKIEGNKLTAVCECKEEKIIIEGYNSEISTITEVNRALEDENKKHKDSFHWKDATIGFLGAFLAMFVLNKILPKSR
jgi:hypothetical protein